jgi:hypothetical protein
LAALAAGGVDMSLLPGGEYDPMAMIFGNRGPSWLPQGQRSNPFPTGGGPLGNQQQPGIMGILGRPETQDLALSLLANSGYSPNKRSFGEILGTSALQSRQMGAQRQDDELKRKMMEAQMGQIGGQPTAVIGPDGKPVYVAQRDAIGQSPYLQGSRDDGIGQYNPRDYTPKSWAQFLADKDPSKLERYESPRQEFKPSFRNVTRTLPDGSTQIGSYDTSTGMYDWNGEIVPPGTKPRVDAQGTAQGKIAGERAANNPRAYEVYKAGIAGLDKALSNTVTGPIAGRIPAMTSAQQIGEGAVDIAQPVLKQLFRDAGEGTFTEGDQALLLRMTPNRKDSAEARKAKLEMIDAIVRAKLGMQEDGQSPAIPAPSNATKKRKYNPVTGLIE